MYSFLLFICFEDGKKNPEIPSKSTNFKEHSMHMASLLTDSEPVCMSGVRSLKSFFQEEKNHTG